MGQRGPMPLRSDEKGPRHQNDSNGLPVTKGQARGTKKIPSADRTWPPRVKQWYNALKESGQSDYYEESDWATAMIIGDALAGWYAKLPKDRSSMMLDTIFRQTANLGVTEGDRRRMRIELEVPEIPQETVGAAASRMWEEELTGPASATVTPIGLGKVDAP